MANFVYYFCVIFLNVILAADAWPSNNRSLDVEPIPKAESANEDIIFPDQYSTKLRFGDEAEDDFIPSGKGEDCIADICKDAKDYPYDKIKQVIGKIKVYSKLFNTVEGSVVELPSRFKPPGEEGGEPLCGTNTHTFYPKQMKNENNIERFIVNVDDLKQGLVFETCIEDSKCRYESLFPTTTKCTQRYARRKLMAMVDGNPAIDSFIVPSCCLCTIVKKK